MLPFLSTTPEIPRNVESKDEGGRRDFFVVMLLLLIPVIFRDDFVMGVCMYVYIGTNLYIYCI